MGARQRDIADAAKRGNASAGQHSLAGLSAVNAALASSSDPRETLLAIAAEVGAALDAAAIEIWSFTAARDGAVLEALWQAGAPGDTGAVPDNATVAALSDRPDLQRLLDGDDLIEGGLSVVAGPWSAGAAADGATRTHAIALRAGDETIGCLGVTQPAAAKKLSAAERRRVTALAAPVAAAVRGATLARRADEAGRRAHSLCAASRALATATEPDETVAAIVAQVAALVGGADCRAGVFLRGDDGRYVAFPPRERSEADVAEAESPNELERRALEERRTVSIAVGRGARLASPLLLRGAPLGFLSVVSSRARPFSPEELADIESMAEQIAFTLDVARLRRAVQRLTTTDTLTSLKNREFLFERLAAEIARAHRYREPLSLVMVDLDDFREFNARHGNREGDRLLRAVANLIRSSVRQRIDIVCRYGGEEFAVLLPNTPTTAASAGVVAERIRMAIETTKFRDENDDLLGHITASVGVAGYPLHADDADDLAAAALAAVRAAKAAGKNTVGLYTARH